MSGGDLMRLDSRSVPYRVAENVARIAGVVVFSLVAGGGGEGGFTGTLVFVGLGVLAVAAWEAAYVRRFTYQVAGNTFDIQSGVFSRRDREIPFNRIQNIDIAQNVVQRAIGIAEVRIETAGGGDSEARLQYVKRSEATRLQELISDRKHKGTERDPGAPDETLFELKRRELTVLGLTSANFQLLAAVFVLFSLAGSAGAQQSEMVVPQPRMQLLLLLGPALALAGLGLLWVVSGVRSVLRYYGFRLLRHSEELRYERGLLQRYNGTIPLSKVQTLMIRENVLARAAGYASLVIETAGYSPGQGSDSVESAVPIARRDRVFELADTIEDIGDIEFDRPPKRARTRYLARYTIVVAGVVALAGAYHLTTGQLGDWYLAATVWVLVPPAAHLKWRQLGYHYDDKHIVTRQGFWTRRTTIVPYYRVQTVSDSQTLFQRRRDLATLVVDTASSGGFWGGDAIALDIDTDVARSLREEFHDRFQESIVRRADRSGRDSLLGDETAADGGGRDIPASRNPERDRSR